jgi:hypothetical protein
LAAITARFWARWMRPPDAGLDIGEQLSVLLHGFFVV